MATNPTTVYSHFQPDGRRLMVRGLRPGLTERGKIKIGRKGSETKSAKGTVFQPPQKLDHFIVTTMVRGQDGNFIRDEEIHREIGDRPTRLPVRLLFDQLDLNFQTRYAAYEGRSVWCQGDGESATRRGHDGPIICPCRNLERDYSPQAEQLGPPCKINGRFQVMLDLKEAAVGGVWVFRTTSWNSCTGLTSSMALLLAATGGKLAGIPLQLTLQPKAATDPQGRAQTVYVVGLEYDGGFDQLRQMAYEAALDEAKHQERLQLVHDTARALIAAPLVGGDDDVDVVQEFYPEQAARAAGAPPSARAEAASTGIGRARFAPADPDETIDQDTGEITSIEDAPGSAWEAPGEAPPVGDGDGAPDAAAPAEGPPAAPPEAVSKPTGSTISKAALEEIRDGFMGAETPADYWELLRKHGAVLDRLAKANGPAWQRLDRTLAAARTRLGIEVGAGDGDDLQLGL